MTESTPNQPTQQWQPPMAPPAAPGGAGNSFEMYGTGPAAPSTTESSVRRGPKHLGRLGLAAALVVTAGVGGYVVKSALSDPAGPQSPGEAFEQFFVAVDNEDLAGVLELLPPGERETLVEPTAAVMRQLQRLEVLDPAADTSALGGFDLTVSGVSYSVEELDPRLAWVTTTGGTITGTNLDADQLPFGSVIRDAMDSAEEAANGQTLDEAMAETEGQSNDLGQDPFSLAVVEDDGGWYVSLTYTMAESARRDAEMLFPGLGNGPAPVGGATPGDAVKGLVQSAIDLDLGGVIAHLDPVEMAALYDYSPLFLDDVDAGAQSFTDEVGDLTLDRLDVRSWERNGRTMVGIDGFAGSLSGIDPYSGEPIDGSIDFDGDCYTVTMAGETEELCASDAAASADAADVQQLAKDMIDELGIDISAFEDLTFPEQGITVVERDGRWYVSTVPSMMYPMAEILEQFEADSFTNLVDSITALIEEGGDPLYELENEIFGGGIYPEEDVDYGDGSFSPSDNAGETDNFVVEKLIPAGTPGSVLLSEGYVSVISVPDEELDFSTVWYIDLEIGELSALRDIQVGEVLMIDDFG
ncbi:MAG: hypothetical protein R2733_19360 [Acidimicrobiales bacterium]